MNITYCCKNIFSLVPILNSLHKFISIKYTFVVQNSNTNFDFPLFWLDIIFPENQQFKGTAKTLISKVM